MKPYGRTIALSYATLATVATLFQSKVQNSWIAVLLCRWKPSIRNIMVRSSSFPPFWIVESFTEVSIMGKTWSYT